MKITRGQCLKGKNMMMKGVRNKRPFIVTPWSRVMLPARGPEFDGLRWETCHLHGPHIEQKNKGPDINKPDGDLHSVCRLAARASQFMDGSDIGTKRASGSEGDKSPRSPHCQITKTQLFVSG